MAGQIRELIKRWRADKDGPISVKNAPFGRARRGSQSFAGVVSCDPNKASGAKKNWAIFYMVWLSQNCGEANWRIPEFV